MPLVWSRSFLIQSGHTSAPENPTMRRRSASAVTARRGMLDAMRPNLEPSAAFASGDRNESGWVPAW
jgi:hypothetical protein